MVNTDKLTLLQDLMVKLECMEYSDINPLEPMDDVEAYSRGFSEAVEAIKDFINETKKTLIN